jgi:hypothetical protein
MKFYCIVKNSLAIREELSFSTRALKFSLSLRKILVNIASRIVLWPQEGS